jgi:hypothetical protein
MQNVTRIVALAFFVSGCGAGFGVDRPPSGGNGASDGGASDGGAGGQDAGDLAVAAAADLAGVSPGADLAMPASGPQTIASGMFVKGQQNGGDTGSGSGSLVRNVDGSESAVFGADFHSSQVPAPEVVLTSRSAIGTGGIQSGDLDLGPLKSSTGAQQYALPGADGGRRNLFVYCTTFGIDVAVAHLQ